MSRPSPHGADPSVLRRLNSAAVLRALRAGGEFTLSALAERVGVSRPTAEGVLGELTARGLVAEAAPRHGAGLGRPARRYRFRAEAGHALGIDIDAHRVRLLVTDLAGDAAGGHRADVRADAPPAERIAAVRAAVKTCLAAARVERRSLRAVAAGTPGVVDPRGTVASCTVVPGWAGVPLARELGRSFGCPVLVENDANLAALAERWRGAARDADDVVCVHAGLHTGVGVLIGGRLHRGRGGAAGEIGMLPELGLRDTAARAAAEPPARLAARMSRGVAAMALALDPEMIVVGGPLVRPGGPLVAELAAAVRPLCLGPVRIEESPLGDESVSLGAVRLALDRIDEDLFSPGPARRPDAPAIMGHDVGRGR
ncbi:ROK family transcriptional regulator [Actinomadura algeriensis]|uniref:NBD/HSP70 family sugar kinase n=1 Tax=Actinomadura algeriensis TaxID=1679523 RepID=A0ABR9K4L5_9ACTN|nr:ROK family protein [Actinomadura algeriensis]MBE1537747.1 putative NBD/HSP70 family sugar kinase [Actinomadura algeriensis]